MPDAPEPVDEVESASTPADEERQFELLLAGFRACAKEALRFLLEEEGLSPDHPLPAGLNEHLVRQQCHLAGAIQNDSGIDFEESFICTSTDGDTRIAETELSFDSSYSNETCDDSNVSQLPSEEHVTEAVEQTINFLRNQIDYIYRTESIDSNQ